MKKALLVPLVFAASTAFAGIDVVWEIDESGSMGDDQADVRANAQNIFANLPAGSSSAVVGYGNFNVVPRLVSPMTTDATTFQNAVNALGTSGGQEPGYQAVFQAATDTVAQGSIQYTGDPVCHILVSDEHLDQGGNSQAQAIAALQAQGGIFFGIVPGGTPTTQAQALAAATGGAVFDLGAFRQNATPVLEAVIAACVEAAIPVALDIKPTSCPNPIAGKGVLPVALLGSEEFDASTINVDSLRLNGECSALKSSLEDVATPFDGERSDPPAENDCGTAGADGWVDLTVKFDKQCGLATSPATEREVELWTVSGTYTNAEGAEVEFETDDVVRVMP